MSVINSAEDVQRAIDNETFNTILLAETQITFQPSGEPGRQNVRFVFPSWFGDYISEDSRNYIIAQISSFVATYAEERSE